MDFVPPQAPPPEPEHLIKWKAPKPNLVKLEQKLRKLKFEDWDVVSFFRTGAGRNYHLDVIKMKPRADKQPHVYEMHPEGCGMKFIVLSAEGLDGMKRWEATMGDPIWILLNLYVKAEHEGFFMKKCPATVAMADDVQNEANKIAEKHRYLMNKLKQEQNVAVLKL